MTERKPPTVRWESWVERQIREAGERGAFDELPGAGRPLPSTGEPYDELWWVREKARRENLSLLPPTLLVRKKAEHLDEHLHRLRSEADVRAAVADLNAEIVDADRTAFGGPPSRLLPRDPEAVLGQWRQRRAALQAEAVARAVADGPDSAAAAPTSPRRWPLRRWLRRRAGSA